jgi:hypothetical protein
MTVTKMGKGESSLRTCEVINGPKKKLEKKAKRSTFCTLYSFTPNYTMGPAKKEKTAPSGRELMTAQQKKDADIANMGAKAASKAAGGADEKPKKLDIGAQKAAAGGGKQKIATDLSFLDAAIPKKK